jgi:hypothetical protein
MLHVNACAFVVAIEAQAKPKLAICCSVMAGLVPAIHVFCTVGDKTWMPRTSPGMTVIRHVISVSRAA